MQVNVEVLRMMVAIVGVVIAIGFDWKLRKIPNLLTIPMVCTGLILYFLQNGFAGVSESALGFGAGLLLLFLPFAMGGIGGGDVKLLAALGGLLGPAVIFQVFLASALFGGAFSIVVMMRENILAQSFYKIKNQAFYFFLTQKIVPLETSAANAKRLSIPYAYAIGCGTLFILFVVKEGSLWTF